jgi:hypothetical protein
MRAYRSSQFPTLSSNLTLAMTEPPGVADRSAEYRGGAGPL